MITNAQSGTNVHEIADGIYRISTLLPAVPGGFSFNQYLVVDEEPLLFHTILKHTFPLVRDALASVMPVEKLRYIAFSHFESDEYGALNLLLGAAPQAQALCSHVAAMVSVDDFADRFPRPLADGETVSLGRRRVRWIDAPHVPHGWETGFLMEETTRTLLCGDLFTQGGTGQTAVTESDILGPSEAFRKPWTTTRTPPRPGRSSRRSRPASPRRSPACTVARGRATAVRCCASSRARSGREDVFSPGQAFVKRLPGESIATPFRQSGHSASGQDGTDRASSDR
jgi:glyoxylase-like metal-dependent hydrolase (beta-lactamase superfamily II)